MIRPVSLRFPLHSRLVALSALAIPLVSGCPSADPAATTRSASPDKRWEDFKKGNAREVETAQSAYERRQEQLAAKRRQAAGGTAPSPEAEKKP
ncbi:MAG: hypothetical protein SFU56_01435 [Capsulimonadales bacterium]|nr:hypothetical protein [Capsulimonadales bacterium]